MHRCRIWSQNWRCQSCLISVGTHEGKSARWVSWEKAQKGLWREKESSGGRELWGAGAQTSAPTFVVCPYSKANGCFKLTVAAVWKADGTRETGCGENKGSRVTLSIKEEAWKKWAFVDGVVTSANGKQTSPRPAVSWGYWRESQQGTHPSRVHTPAEWPGAGSL